MKSEANSRTSKANYLNQYVKFVITILCLIWYLRSYRSERAAAERYGNHTKCQKVIRNQQVGSII